MEEPAKDMHPRGVGSTEPDKRRDDRNEELDESPVPDPEEREGEPSGDDDPEAD
jgi:hypothetical protein